MRAACLVSPSAAHNLPPPLPRRPDSIRPSIWVWARRMGKRHRAALYDIPYYHVSLDASHHYQPHANCARIHSSLKHVPSHGRACNTYRFAYLGRSSACQWPRCGMFNTESLLPLEDAELLRGLLMTACRSLRGFYHTSIPVQDGRTCSIRFRVVSGQR